MAEVILYEAVYKTRNFTFRHLPNRCYWFTFYLEVKRLMSSGTIHK